MKRSTLSCQSKEKGHPFRVWRVLSATERSFNETAMQARTQARNCLAKAIKASHASHGPRVSPQSQVEEKVKKTMENPKGSPKEPKVRSKFPKAQATRKTLTTGISDLENLKSEASPKNQESVQMGQVCITETSLIHEEWSLDERNNDWS